MAVVVVDGGGGGDSSNGNNKQLEQFENDENSGKRYRKLQMIETDDDGGVSGDDCTAAEASAECSDMRGKLYFSLDWIVLLQLDTGLLYYTMSTL
jgi:hypothetical protein